MKISVPAAVWMVQSASLPGRRSLRVADWRPTSFSRLRFRRSSAWSIDHSSSFVACIGLSASQWSKASRTVDLDDARRFLRGEAVLGLALEFRLADEHRQHGGGRAHHVVGGDLRRPAVVGQLAVGAQALRQRRAQAGLVRAAVGRRDGVAVGAREAVVVGDPGDRPFDRAVAVLALGAAGEQILGHHACGRRSRSSGSRRGRRGSGTWRSSACRR